MLTIARLVASLGVAWAAGSLAAQVLRARGAEHADYSLPAGDPLRGAIYNLTAGLSPTRKESARHHPLAFATGVVFHAGILTALLAVLLLLFRPPAGTTLLALARPLLLLALAAGVALFVRRLASRRLRAISVPDDYLAVLASSGFLFVALLFGTGSLSPVPFLIYAFFLFAYMPLGKLRHAVFFFVARADLGRRLGHRGVYPPPHARPENRRA